jgi:ABC-type amino acid transport substrate-binding protein
MRRFKSPGLTQRFLSVYAAFFSVPSGLLPAFLRTRSWPSSLCLAHAETPTRLDAIVASGTVRVGSTEDDQPFSFADASGEVGGIDVDMR